MFKFFLNKPIKILSIFLLSLMSFNVGLSQCEVHIIDGSVEVEDFYPGVKFTFDVINESILPWGGGNLYVGWTLESSNPNLSPVMWEIELAQDLNPGETITLNSPIFDYPAVWDNPLSNSPDINNPWDGALEWSNYNFDTGFTGNWSVFKLTLGCENWVSASDAIIAYKDGLPYYGPLESGCPNINNDFLCDCNIEFYNFNLENTYSAEIIVLSDYNCFPSTYPEEDFQNPGLSNFMFGINFDNFDDCNEPSYDYSFLTIDELNIPSYSLGDTISLDLTTSQEWDSCIEDYIYGDDFTNCYESIIWKINSSNIINGDNGVEITPNDNVIFSDGDFCKRCDLELINVEWPYITVVANDASGCYNENLPAWLEAPPSVIHNFTVHFFDGEDGLCSISFSNSAIPDLSTGDTLTFSIEGNSECFLNFEGSLEDLCGATVQVTDINNMVASDDNPFNNYFILDNNSVCSIDVSIENINILSDGCDPINGFYIIPEIDILVEGNTLNYFCLTNVTDTICFDGEYLADTIYTLELDTLYFGDIPAEFFYNFQLINVNDPEHVILPFGEDVDGSNNSYFDTLQNNCIYGCMDETAMNFDPLADVEDNSCEYLISGCMSLLASNYNPEADVDDGSCIFAVDLGIDTLTYTISDCTDGPLYWTPQVQLSNFGTDPITEFCVTIDVIGSVEPEDTLCVYGITLLPGESMTVDFPSIFVGSGIEDVVSLSAINVNGENDFWFFFFGDDDFLENNYFVDIIDLNCEGCMDENADNYNPYATSPANPDICEYFGCMDENANNYDPYANVDDGSCEYDVYGCTDAEANNYNPGANVDDGSCEYDVYGCTDPEANNYNPNANIDDDSCEYDVYGCTDVEANNYNPGANIDDGSCEYDVYGCTDPQAVNYNPLANIEDGTCMYINTGEPCDDLMGETFIPNALSPNGDGLNDYWGIITSSECWRSWNLRIYNRWGGMIWQSNNPDDFWDGKMNNGQYASDGIYVYFIIAESNNSHYIQKDGYIMLFK